MEKKNFEKKSYNAKTNCKGDALVSTGFVCYAENILYFSSLSQMVQFGTLKFRRTILNSSRGLGKVLKRRLMDEKLVTGSKLRLITDSQNTTHKTSQRAFEFSVT